MKSLSNIDDPEDPLLWESFPAPSTVPALPPYELDGTALIARPFDALLDTDHIHDRVWYTSAFQNLDNPRRSGIHMVEVAFVLNNLGCTDQQIIDNYRNMFPHSLLRVGVLQWLITEGRWKAKCLLWLPEELDIIRRAVSDVVLATFSDVSQLPTAQDMDLSAWEALRRRWAFYPKSYNRVSAKCAEL